MKLNLIIKSNIYDTKSILYECDDNILVKDFLEDIYNKYYNTFNTPPSCEELIGHFDFLKCRKRQKAQLDYLLKDFLDSFKYRYDRLKMEFIDGIGGGFGFGGFADIRINNGEPHSEPHVHIYSNRKGDGFVRIALNTMTQMYGDKVKFNKIFNKKQRDLLLRFLRENKNELIELYNRSNKGELITKEYEFALDGEVVTTYTCGKYISIQ